MADTLQAFERRISGLTDGVVVVDPDRRVLFANPAAEAILGHEPDGLLGLCWAVGPFLVGFDHPVADLSRSATVEEIVATAAVLAGRPL